MAKKKKFDEPGEEEEVKEEEEIQVTPSGGLHLKARVFKQMQETQRVQGEQQEQILAILQEMKSQPILEQTSPTSRSPLTNANATPLGVSTRSRKRLSRQSAYMNDHS